jgi:pyruvate dehydrogenase E2 component (dihydrolipoamide acetyltransferase)
MIIPNLGMFEVSAFSAIVIPPQVAILATARARPVLDLDLKGRPVRRMRMTVTVSADHRAVDGIGVARFLGDLKRLLETPDVLQVG